MRAFVLVLLIALFAASARADEASPRLVRIEVPGIAGDGFDVDSLGLREGDVVDRQALRRVFSALARSSRWADAAARLVPEGDGVVLVVELTPRVLLARLQISGNDVVQREELLRTMQIGPGDSIDRATLEELRSRALELYASRGYPNATFAFERRDTNDPTRKVLVVRIDEGAPLEIARVVFTGSPPPPPFDEDARSFLGVSPGDVLNRAQLQSSLRELERRLRDKGFLEAAVSEWQIHTEDDATSSLAIELRAGPRYEVIVEGHSPVLASSVAEALLNPEERFSRGTGIRALRDRAIDLFKRHGFEGATATVDLDVSRDESRATLRVHVEHGRQLHIDAMLFEGATHFEQSFLRDQIVSYLEEDIDGVRLLYPVDSDTVDRVAGGRSERRSRDVPEPLVVEPGAVFYEPTYLAAIEHIVELYQADGFLEVTVSPPMLDRTSDSHANVRFEVVEGPQTRVHGVRFEGNEALASRTLAEAVSLDNGEAFSHLALEDARLAVLELYRERGYFYARVTASTHFSPDRTNVRVVFDIAEGTLVTVSEIVIRGLGMTLETVARGALPIEEGDLLRPSRIRNAEERLLELGVFSGVTISPEAEDLPAREKRLIITVTERPSQYLEGSGGLSTGQGLRAGFEYGHRNIFGTAISLSLRAQFAYQFFFVEPILRDRFEALTTVDRLGRRITATMSVPYLPGLRDLRASLNFVHIRSNERDFGYDKNGVVLTLNYSPVRRLAFTLSEELENNNVDLFVGESLAALQETTTDPRLQRLLRVPQGESTLVATRMTASLDFRDSPFVPTRGFFSSIAAEWARTVFTERLADGEKFFSDFVKLNLTASGYVPVVAGIVFAVQLRVGGVVRLDPASKTYPNRQFFLGGVDTIRGYPQDAMIPQELATAISRGEATPDAILRGGDAFFLLRSEVRFPITGAIQGGIFCDLGNLWADARNINPLDLRATAGIGLRVTTPVGPIALDYGFILDRRRVPVGASGDGFVLNRPYEPFGSFHFSIGVF
jgi:outer membrane protein insertion porin family